MEQMNIKFCEKYKQDEIWENLLTTADSDFVSCIILAHCGLLLSTSLWMAPHSIEKYCKNLLLKSDPKINPKKFSHNIEHLWNELKESFPKEKFFQSDYYQIFIKQLNNLDITVRYTHGISINDPLFTQIYVSLANQLRYLTLGEEQFRERGPFGLCDAFFGGLPPFYKDPIDVKKIVCDFIERVELIFIMERSRIALKQIKPSPSLLSREQTDNSCS